VVVPTRRTSTPRAEASPKAAATWSSPTRAAICSTRSPASEGRGQAGYAYIGYGDLDRSHPWTDGLYKRARQMFDPVGLGYPLLMERDQ